MCVCVRKSPCVRERGDIISRHVICQCAEEPTPTDRCCGLTSDPVNWRLWAECLGGCRRTTTITTDVKNRKRTMPLCSVCRYSVGFGVLFEKTCHVTRAAFWTLLVVEDVVNRKRASWSSCECLVSNKVSKYTCLSSEPVWVNMYHVEELFSLLNIIYIYKYI